MMLYLPKHCRTNNERLYALKDKHKGGRCVIVGNGPSLAIRDLDRLKDEITVASNRIFLAFSETEWRPTYFTMCDVVVARENKDAIKALPLFKVFAGSVRKYYYDDPHAVLVNPPRLEDDRNARADVEGVLRLPGDRPPPEPGHRVWMKRLCLAPGTGGDAPVNTLAEDTRWPAGWNLLRGARAGHSVINLGLKIAYWMGIREVYVIGCDHKFQVPDTETGEIVYNNKVIVSKGEINHFHPDYRKPGEKWTLPRLDLIARDFAYARCVYEADGRIIRNASRFSALDVWEKVDFDTVFP